MEQLGPYAFIAGVLLALLAGVFSGFFAPYLGWVVLLLVALGLVVGFLNVSDKETTAFLVAGIGLMATAGAAKFAYYLGPIQMGAVGSILDNVLGFIAVFVVPAVLIVALKAVYSMGSAK